MTISSSTHAAQMALFCSFLCVCVLFLVAKQLYWVDQRVCYGFSIRSYRKNRINFLANPTCVYHILFIHSSVDGHLGCSYVLTIAYSAAMNIGVHVTFHIMIFIQMFVQQWELHDHMVTFLKKKFSGTSKLFSTVAVPIYIPTKSVGGFLFVYSLSSIDCL